jgi:hypothetical protein
MEPWVRQDARVGRSAVCGMWRSAGLIPTVQAAANVIAKGPQSWWAGVGDRAVLVCACCCVASSVGAEGDVKVGPYFWRSIWWTYLVCDVWLMLSASCVWWWRVLFPGGVV